MRRAFESTTNAPAYAYDPYGTPLQATAPVTDFNYAGMFTNADSSLDLTQYRVYNPVIGRWLSRDPLGEASDPGANLYRYVLGNPISFADPLGLWTYAITAAAGYGVSVNIGYNGGQWSAGAYVGVGEGLSGVYSGVNTGCESTGPEFAVTASGVAYVGATGIDYDIEATKSGQYTADATAAVVGVGGTATVAAGQSGVSVTYSPTVGAGESTFVGVGGTWHFVH